MVARVPCRTSPDRRQAPLVHDVRIEPDWTIQMPHDLDSERLAVAFGGYLSCVILHDRVVPALRLWLRRMLRLDAGRLFGVVRGGWAVVDTQRCCGHLTFPTAVDAAVHAMSVPHVAAAWQADVDLLSTLAGAASKAHGAFELRLDNPVLWPASAACLGGFSDVEYLYRCGLSPEWVVRVHAQAGVDEPLSRSSYLLAAAGIQPESSPAGNQ